MKLKSIWIETTTRCNLKCKSCGSLKGKEDIDLGLFNKIAEQCFSNIEEVNVTGVGEPTMTRNFIQIVLTIIEQYNKRLIIISHGMLLNRNSKLLDVLLNDNVHLTISVDGIGEIFEKIRFGAKWDAMLELFQKINQIKCKKELTQFTLGINFTLNTLNRECLPDIIRLSVEQWHIDYLHVILMQPWNLNMDFFKANSPMNSDEKTNDILEKSRLIALETGLNVIFPTTFDSKQSLILEKRLIRIRGWFRKIKSKLSNSKFKNIFYALPATIYIRHQTLYKIFYNLLRIKKKHCKVPEERLFFKINGEVTPCCGMQNYVLGSMNKQNLNDILSDKPYSNLINGFTKGYLPIECLRCHLPMGPNYGN
ncbi:radical SAM protein [Candidatus Parabeggiatoa sp. HSG14]|uniref:radical SAM protein n=1 Tax=Candidatus Parabeggiatoa sp. HSG14 TaxID=3055593 RepID=UPI0025A7F375|nr:SPASM domain-containing protein [Thiotrichales bacterium HSG14]